MESATGISTEMWYVITLVIGIVSGTLGYFLRQTMSRVEAHDEDINTIKQTYVTKSEMSEMKDELKDDVRKITQDVADIKENYLSKSDFYRVQAGTDKKLDKIYDLVLRNSGGKSYE